MWLSVPCGDRNVYSAGSSEIENEKGTKTQTLSDKIIAAYKFFAHVILVRSLTLCVCALFFVSSCVWPCYYYYCFFFVHRTAAAVLFISLENDVAAIALAVHCRQPTTFPYNSIEMAGWLADWLCLGQRLNVTAIKTK